MARPRRAAGIKPPNEAMLRVQPKIKPLIKSVYRFITGANNKDMPIGDKLESILKYCEAARKKEETLEGEIRELSQLIAKQYGFQENKPLEVTV